MGDVCDTYACVSQTCPWKKKIAEHGGTQKEKEPNSNMACENLKNILILSLYFNF